ncbi:hypothetical protein SDRG_02435 [Saprolegnia diclina VS20]|uniref:Elicitin n=1 Tax=Saprolegnia diclina (strain VS20) TaxID=1156394 RepID=T0R2L9_SAPDV|nr:hypothetical protein SDRG_02435 [Saprolegnia diclina VS20]EQC40545.1 hypothetical protein SDRG_02435 [Saprolegnia diclina VS20]|eukprot:XP_008606244.1 hypothetical protein SDRG_02435 [Saprolegnia diclina VS20]
MKLTVLTTLAVCAMAANLKTPIPAKFTVSCSTEENAILKQLQSTSTYVQCVKDGPTSVDDICAVHSCVDAAQNLVGKVPNCISNTSALILDVELYVLNCGVDRNLIVPTNHTDSNATTVPIVTVPANTITPEPKKAAPSAAIANSASLLAMGAVIYAMA